MHTARRVANLRSATIFSGEARGKAATSAAQRGKVDAGVLNSKQAPPGSILPEGEDDNEEINLQWRVILFEGNISG